ncbi:hypothetical protein ASF61_02050 [Duganella sp. Leaf126]|uniref:hypothetical protein n=1 Tax=Duganella sp. Leaf126 TaxID=1736266 RepID=UPI0006F4DB97|nr:hypothetical protein [Duganella sp. Leaf126]KQQ47766.1 hypothetical protein ASF61_02050 [Duganella sp. Leaf126]
MDQHKLRTLVFEKTGVRIDIDDPVFALVALNEAVLEDAVERHVAAIDSATRELLRRARDAGGLPPERHRGHDASNELGPDDAAHAGAAPVAASVTAPGAGSATTHRDSSAVHITVREWRLLAAAAGVAVLSALLVLAGQAAFTKPGPTAAQLRSLQEAEQLKAAIDRLDPKLRAEVRSQLPR